MPGRASFLNISRRRGVAVRRFPIGSAPCVAYSRRSRSEGRGGSLRRASRFNFIGHTCLDADRNLLPSKLFARSEFPHTRQEPTIFVYGNRIDEAQIGGCSRRARRCRPSRGVAQQRSGRSAGSLGGNGQARACLTAASRVGASARACPGPVRLLSLGSRRLPRPRPSRPFWWKWRLTWKCTLRHFGVETRNAETDALQHGGPPQEDESLFRLIFEHCSGSNGIACKSA